MTGLTEEEENELLALLEYENNLISLEDFILKVGVRLSHPSHVDPLVKLIERTRHEEVRALVSMPPRHAKTYTLVAGLAWRVICDRACLNAYVSYNDDIARDQAKNIRRYVEENGVILAKDSSAADNWRTKQRGGLISAGVGGGSLTGKGINGGILLIDDPIKNRIEAESPTVQQRTLDWFFSVAYPRLEKGASVIVCMTRWHPNDLIGYLSKDPSWEQITLSACFKREMVEVA